MKSTRSNSLQIARQDHSTRKPLQPNDQVLTPGGGHDIPSAVRSPANRRAHDLDLGLKRGPVVGVLTRRPLLQQSLSKRPCHLSLGGGAVRVSPDLPGRFVLEAVLPSTFRPEVLRAGV